MPQQTPGLCSPDTGHVLVELARDPGARPRDIAAVAGFTERAALLVTVAWKQPATSPAHGTDAATDTPSTATACSRHSARDGHRIGPFLLSSPARAIRSLTVPIQRQSRHAATHKGHRYVRSGANRLSRSLPRAWRSSLDTCI